MNKKEYFEQLRSGYERSLDKSLNQRQPSHSSHGAFHPFAPTPPLPPSFFPAHQMESLEEQLMATGSSLGEVGERKRVRKQVRFQVYNAKNLDSIQKMRQDKEDELKKFSEDRSGSRERPQESFRQESAHEDRRSENDQNLIFSGRSSLNNRNISHEIPGTFKEETFGQKPLQSYIDQLKESQLSDKSSNSQLSSQIKVAGQSSNQNLSKFTQQQNPFSPEYQSENKGVQMKKSKTYTPESQNLQINQDLPTKMNLFEQFLQKSHQSSQASVKNIGQMGKISSQRIEGSPGQLQMADAEIESLLTDFNEKCNQGSFLEDVNEDEEEHERSAHLNYSEENSVGKIETGKTRKSRREKEEIKEVLNNNYSQEKMIQLVWALQSAEQSISSEDKYFAFHKLSDYLKSTNKKIIKQQTRCDFYLMRKALRYYRYGLKKQRQYQQKKEKAQQFISHRMYLRKKILLLKMRKILQLEKRWIGRVRKELWNQKKGFFWDQLVLYWKMRKVKNMRKENIKYQFLKELRIMADKDEEKLERFLKKTQRSMLRRCFEVIQWNKKYQQKKKAINEQNLIKYLIFRKNQLLKQGLTILSRNAQTQKKVKSDVFLKEALLNKQEFFSVSIQKEKGLSSKGIKREVDKKGKGSAGLNVVQKETIKIDIAQ